MEGERETQFIYFANFYYSDAYGHRLCPKPGIRH